MREGENPEVKRVSGYRVLTDNELALVNQLKDAGPAMVDMIAKIDKEILQGPPDLITERMRSLALGKTNLQQAYMWLIRSVAAPQGLV